MQTFKNPAMPPVIERDWQVLKYTCIKAKAGVFNMKRIEYINGDVIGKCVFIHDTTVKKGRRCAIFKCRCGKEFEARISSIKSNGTLSCGCLNDDPLKGTTHGLTHNPIYKTWQSIKLRCYNVRSKSYQWYGKRGIAMYKPWMNDFKAFYDYVIALPDYDKNNISRYGLTLDRYPNNDGNYEPNNLRWATSSQQMANRGMMRNNTSGYKGVTWDKCNGKWRSSICIEYNQIYLGSFDKKDDAVDARNKYIASNNLTERKIQE